MGYSGGKKLNPTYTDLGDHTETIQLDYDAASTSYSALLKLFWALHDPTLKCGSEQYKPVIFFHDQAQKTEAEQTRAAEAKRRGATIHTEILPASTFYFAEDYHQKYYLTYQPLLLKEIRHHYPKVKDLVHSTAAARLNGYSGGFGDLATLKKEIHSLGLTSAGRAKLLTLVTS